MCLASLKYVSGNCWQKFYGVWAYGAGHVPKGFGSYFDNRSTAQSTDAFQRVKQEQFEADGDGIVYMVHRLKKIPAETERMDDIFYKQMTRNKAHRAAVNKGENRTDSTMGNASRTRKYIEASPKKSACEIEHRDFNYLFRRQRCY